MKTDKCKTRRVCSVDRTLKIVGDRWSFLVLREAFFGVRNFDTFLANTGMATNILANRLNALVENGILKRLKDPQDARRNLYKLTEKGLDLYPATLALMQWGDRWLSGEEGPPLELCHTKCGHRLKPVTCCAHCGNIVSVHEVSYEDNMLLKSFD